MIRVGMKSSGFTIIELLVVIASTGILLGIAFAFIGNQVNQTGFQTGTRSFQTQLQTILNQVTSGSYTFPNDVSCSGNTNPATGSPLISIIPTNQGQGSNNGCIFLGKSIYIGNDTSSPYTTNTAKFTAFSIAGNQCSTYISGSAPPCASNPSTLSGAYPTYVMIPDSEDNYNVEGGLRFKYITYDHPTSPSSGTTTLCGFGIINSPSSAGSSFGLYKVEQNILATPPSIGCDSIPSQPSGASPNQYDDGNLVDANIVDSIQLCMYNASNTNQTIGLNISSGTGSSQTQSNNFNISIIGTGC